MNERQDFLQKFAQGVIKANKKMLEQESEEKTRGYEPSQEVPALHELHEQALLEARRKKADSFEIDAIENEMYIKEMKQNVSYDRERENEEQENGGEETPASYKTYNHEPKEERDEEKEKYAQIPEPEAHDEVKAHGEEGYHEPQTWDLEGEAKENEVYQKAHPPEEEGKSFYKSPIESPLRKLTDYDQPRLYTEKPAMEQSKKTDQSASQIESLPVAPLSRYVHQESTTYPLPMLQKTQTRGFIKPASQEEILDTKAGLLKMKDLIKDHAVTYINCPGPLKPVAIKRMGIPEMLKIALDEAGVRQVIKEFSEASRIPYTGSEGIFKAVVGDLMITAIITETVGSRFTILRVIQ